MQGYDPTRRQILYRPLGGGVEFGERARDAVIREIAWELDAELANTRYLATLENIFTFDGQLGHEIILLFVVAFADTRCMRAMIWSLWSHACACRPPGNALMSYPI